MLEKLLVDFKNTISQFFNSGCIINGALLELEKVEKMGYREFSYQSRLCIPMKFYKYYSNKESVQADGSVRNYSLEALKNNTVFMQTPINFDDCYDSDIWIDYAVYERISLAEYCRRCGIVINKELSTNEIGYTFLKAIVKSLYKYHNYQNIFTVTPATEDEKLENRLFCGRLAIEMQSTDDLGKALSKILSEEYNDLLASLKSTFRVSCFTTTPFSQLMWGGSYADEHRGFCLEYTVLPNDEKYTDVFYNLYPMIYCKIRSDISQKISAMKGKTFTEEILWDIYFHGALRKSLDWVFQNEWRLLLPCNSSIENFNIKFFPITKVFLGNRMSADKQKEIINICNEKNIPYVNVVKNPNIFEMQEFKTKQ